MELWKVGEEREMRYASRDGKQHKLQSPSKALQFSAVNKFSPSWKNHTLLSNDSVFENKAENGLKDG